MEVSCDGTNIVIKAKCLVDLEDTLTSEGEKLVEKGFRELKEGRYIAWEELKHKPGMKGLQRGSPRVTQVAERRARSLCARSMRWWKIQ